MSNTSYKLIPKDLSATKLWCCQGCGQQRLIESCGNGLHNGLVLSGFGGYYGGFNDSMFDVDTTQQWDEVNSANLCHHCVVKLLEALPTLAYSLGLTSGAHPSDHNNTPCCQWAWSLDDNKVTHYAKLNVFGNLVWEPRET